MGPSLISSKSTGPSMLHVLVICTHFPPLNRTGARRPYYLARQLRDEGHRVSVLTTAEVEDATWEEDLNGIHVIRCPHSFVQRDMSTCQRLIAKAHHRFQGSILHGPLRVLADLLLPLDHSTRWDVTVEEVQEEVGAADIVVSTGPAWSSFDFGRRLSNSWRSTFLIDYRDPWYVYLPEVGLHSVTWMGAGLSGKLRRMRMKRSERGIISTAAGATAATEGLLRNIRLAGAEPNCVIFNGFESRLKRSPDTIGSGLHLIYTGQIYAEQEWDMVIRAFDLLQDEHTEQSKQIELILSGPRCADLGLLRRINACAERSGSITFIDRVDRDSAMKFQQEADLLLHVAFKEKRGIIPLKFLEYLDAGRPILQASTGQDEQESILERTQTGTICRSAEEIVLFLLRSLVVKNEGGPLPYRPDRNAISVFSWKHQMGRWVNFIMERHLQRKALNL